LTIPTRGRGLCELTSEVERWVEQNRFQDGLLTLHLQHTSASLLIQENADPDVRRDLEAFFKRLVPDGDPLFAHTAEGDDDMPAHIRTALTAVNLNFPSAAGGSPSVPGRGFICGNTASADTRAASPCTSSANNTSAEHCTAGWRLLVQAE